MTAEELLEQSPSDYMSDAQMAFFKNVLQKKLEMLRERVEGYRSACSIDRQADEADMGANEEARSTATRLIEMDAVNIKAVMKALAMIESSEYGYCTDTGAEIGLRRLLVVPESTLSVHSMEVLERQRRHMRAA